MDQIENDSHQSLGICNKLYNFILKSLASYAFKTVTLGHSKDGTIHPIAQGTTNGFNPQSSRALSSTVSIGSSRSTGQNGKDVPASVNACGALEDKASMEAERKKKAPKKMVSINDKVEVIDPSKKKYRRQKTADKKSLAGCQEDEPRPLKPILKVSSRSDNDDNTIPVTKVDSSLST